MPTEGENTGDKNMVEGREKGKAPLFVVLRYDTFWCIPPKAVYWQARRAREKQLITIFLEAMSHVASRTRKACLAKLCDTKVDGESLQLVQQA